MSNWARDLQHVMTSHLEDGLGPEIDSVVNTKKTHTHFWNRMIIIIELSVSPLEFCGLGI